MTLPEPNLSGQKSPWSQICTRSPYRFHADTPHLKHMYLLVSSRRVSTLSIDEYIMSPSIPALSQESIPVSSTLHMDMHPSNIPLTSVLLLCSVSTGPSHKILEIHLYMEIEVRVHFNKGSMFQAVDLIMSFD